MKIFGSGLAGLGNAGSLRTFEFKQAIAYDWTLLAGASNHKQ